MCFFLCLFSFDEGKLVMNTLHFAFSHLIVYTGNQAMSVHRVPPVLFNSHMVCTLSYSSRLLWVGV